MSKFENKKELLKKLDLFLPIVVRVHGKEHAEMVKIGNIYDESLREKLHSKKEENLDEEFKTIRELSNNYTIPNGVCESYEAVYDMLKELDEINNK